MVFLQTFTIECFFYYYYYFLIKKVLLFFFPDYVKPLLQLVFCVE